jgi:hypothetical protein
LRTIIFNPAQVFIKETWSFKSHPRTSPGGYVNVTRLGKAYRSKMNKLAWHQWLMPIILTTQEAEIRKDHGLKPAWENSLPDPISKNKNLLQKGLVERLKV